MMSLRIAAAEEVQRETRSEREERQQAEHAADAAKQTIRRNRWTVKKNTSSVENEIDIDTHSKKSKFSIAEPANNGKDQHRSSAGKLKEANANGPTPKKRNQSSKD